MVENDINEFELKFSSLERAELFFDKLTLIASPHHFEHIRINIKPDTVYIQETDCSHTMRLILHFPHEFFTTHITNPISVGILTNDLKRGTTAADRSMKSGEDVTIKILQDQLILLGSTPHNFFKIPIEGISKPEDLKLPVLITPCASNVNLEDINLILGLLNLTSKENFIIRIEYSSNTLFIQGEAEQRSTKRKIRCTGESKENAHTSIPKQSLDFLSSLAENSENIKIGIFHKGVVHASMDFIDGAKCDLFIAQKAENQQ